MTVSVELTIEHGSERVGGSKLDGPEGSRWGIVLAQGWGLLCPEQSSGSRGQVLSDFLVADGDTVSWFDPEEVLTAIRHASAVIAELDGSAAIPLGSRDLTIGDLRDALSETLLDVEFARARSARVRFENG